MFKNHPKVSRTFQWRPGTFVQGLPCIARDLLKATTDLPRASRDVPWFPEVSEVRPGTSKGALGGPRPSKSVQAPSNDVQGLPWVPQDVRHGSPCASQDLPRASDGPQTAPHDKFQRFSNPLRHDPGGPTSEKQVWPQVALALERWLWSCMTAPHVRTVAGLLVYESVMGWPTRQILFGARRYTIARVPREKNIASLASMLHTSVSLRRWR